MMGAFNSHQAKAMEFVRQVAKTGEPLNILCPSGGRLSLIMNERVYGELHRSIMHKNRAFWNLGRAGFTYTDAPQVAPYTEGVWIFPDLTQALEKRQWMRDNGWNSRYCSWEELHETT